MVPPTNSMAKHSSWPTVLLSGALLDYGRFYLQRRSRI